MKTKTENKIFEAWAYCDARDKSTEFLIAYVSDVANISTEAFVDFMMKPNTDTKRVKWYERQAAKLQRFKEYLKAKGCRVIEFGEAHDAFVARVKGAPNLFDFTQVSQSVGADTWTVRLAKRDLQVEEITGGFFDNHLPASD